MSQSYSPRKTRSQWLALVAQQRRSALSAPAFCKQEAVSYPSFNYWRKRRADTPVEPNQTATPAAADKAPSFIDIGMLGDAGQPPSTGLWNITLKLGNGVELNLSQAQ